MKKLFILLIMSVIAINLSAQESNKSQELDSLQYKFDKLQHDYDYLDCSFLLHRLASDLKIFSNEVNCKSNAILINYYHNGYDPRLYKAYKDNYNASDENLTSSEQNAFTTIWLVMGKMESSTFSESEIKVLEAAIKNVDFSLSAAKSALNYYKVVLGIYKDLD